MSDLNFLSSSSLTPSLVQPLFPLPITVTSISNFFTHLHPLSSFTSFAIQPIIAILSLSPFLILLLFFFFIFLLLFKSSLVLIEPSFILSHLLFLFLLIIFKVFPLLLLTLFMLSHVPTALFQYVFSLHFHAQLTKFH